MLKKIGAIMIALVALLLFMDLSYRGEGLVEEAIYPKHLNGNKNLPLLTGHGGYGHYLEKSSIEVEESSPSRIIISADILSSAIDEFTGEYAFLEEYNPGRVYKKTRVKYLYNPERYEMYYAVGENSWQKIEPIGFNGFGYQINSPVSHGGEAAFYLTYDLKFYGEEKHRSEYLGRNEYPYKDDFYEALQS